MMRNIVIISSFVFGLFYFPIISKADFVVTGPYTALVCDNYMILSTCKHVDIHAVKNPKGQMFGLPKNYDKVDEYNSSNDRCWIKIRSGIFNRLMGDVPTFYSHKSGPLNDTSSYEKINTPEHITFNCRKR